MPFEMKQFTCQLNVMYLGNLWTGDEIWVNMVTIRLLTVATCLMCPSRLVVGHLKEQILHAVGKHHQIQNFFLLVPRNKPSCLPLLLLQVDWFECSSEGSFTEL